MLRTQAVCRPSSQQNRQGKFELLAWTLSPNFFRLNWTFRLPPKRQLRIPLNFFSINKFVFDFCCLCLFCSNAGHHAISRQKYGIQHRVISNVCHIILVTLWCGRTVTWLLRHYQNFFGLIGYQTCLAMVLRYKQTTKFFLLPRPAQLPGSHEEALRLICYHYSTVLWVTEVKRRNKRNEKQKSKFRFCAYFDFCIFFQSIRVK